MATALIPTKLELARHAFVERLERPTYHELSTEFCLPFSTIGNAAADQSWVAMRASYLESKLVEADAASVMLEAVKVDRTLIKRFCSVTLTALDKLSVMLDSIKTENAAQTQAQALNTAAFAIKNLSDAMRSLGVIGVSRTLDHAADQGNGRPNPAMLQQINVNLTGLQAAVASAQAAPSAADPERVTQVEPSAPAT